MPGEYFKFNSNTGHAEPDTATMQALSHFSYHHSNLGDKKDIVGGIDAACTLRMNPLYLQLTPCIFCQLGMIPMVQQKICCDASYLSKSGFFYTKSNN